MVSRRATGQVVLAARFSSAALRYWLGVYPFICRDIRHWHGRAECIPDPVLRRLALDAHRAKRGNVEGAGAFAAFAPRATRRLVARAQVAFQMAYDYADTLAEQPHDRPVLNGHQIHQALRVALDPDACRPDYYAHLVNHDDDDYLNGMVGACRVATAPLPSYRAVVSSLRRLCERIVVYQSLNLTVEQGGHGALSRWALRVTPAGSGLCWWETAASAGSSLGIFALLAMAANHEIERAEVMAVENAYFPWIGALHSLLDSLADEFEDEASGIQSLLGYYVSPAQAAARLVRLAEQAASLVENLPDANSHKMILAAMVSHYLVAPRARSVTATLATEGILDAMGGLALPTKLVMHGKYALSRSPAR
jgi:tetraprenyl-beta-curcumene synthase